MIFIVTMYGLFIRKIKKVTNIFPKALDKSGRKPNKIWVDKDSKFYNRLMKS